jgi:hypothetical protein
LEAGGFALPELDHKVRAERTIDAVNRAQFGVNAAEFEPGNRSLICAHPPCKFGLSDSGILTGTSNTLTNLESSFSAIIGISHLRRVRSPGLDLTPSSMTRHGSILLRRVSFLDTPMHFPFRSFYLCAFLLCRLAEDSE